jgi:FkbM family methyltransferase
MMMKDLAPIVLFAYNRPWHTLQTLNGLANNDLADQSILYVFSDGPKVSATDDDLSNINETRKILKSRSWCKEVYVAERTVNLGLAESIVRGVSEVSSKHGKVIVLEDDILTSKGFLRFMNEALDLYNADNSVMHISGYMFPVKGRLPETFFSKQASCWGWATWERAWRNLETDSQIILDSLKRTRKIEEADIDGTNQFLVQLQNNLNGIAKTWAVKWHFSVILNNGLCLHPGKSLVRNIGLDGTGENSGSNNMYDTTTSDYVDVKRIPIKDNKDVYKLLHKFYRKDPGLVSSVKVALFKLLPESGKKIILLMLNRQFRKSNREVKRLKSLPRYTPTQTELLGRTILILDSPSYLFIKNELFNVGIYKFRSARNNPLIIDCGANIGLSVIYFKELYPQARVIAFEPDEVVFNALKFNIEAFGFVDIQLICRALWYEETTLKFYSEKADAGRIANLDDRGSIVDVKTVRLRQYLNQKVDFLKIDIEGAETVVLKDCQDLLFNVKMIFVEYHSFSGHDQSLPELLAILKGAGYRLNINTPGLSSPNPFASINTYNNMDMQLNIYGWRP